MGTIAYISPEQASGKPVDYRTDIFSLGIVLFALVMGTRPFRGKSPAETMNAIINTPAPPLTDKRNYSDAEEICNENLYFSYPDL